MSDIYQSPSAQLERTPLAHEQGSLERAVTGDYVFSIGDTLSEAWSRIAGRKLTIFLATLIYSIIYGVAIFVIQTVLIRTGMAESNGMGGLEVGVGSIILQLLILAIALPMSAGLLMIGINSAVDRPIAVGQIFQHFSKTPKLLGLTVLMYVLIVIGFLLLILPGIYLSIAYVMATPLIVEKNLGIWEALETSRKTISKRWFAFFGWFLLLGLILAVSIIPLGIGLIWTLPLSMISIGIVYRNMFGVNDIAAQ